VHRHVRERWAARPAGLERGDDRQGRQVEAECSDALALQDVRHPAWCYRRLMEDLLGACGDRVRSGRRAAARPGAGPSAFRPGRSRRAGCAVSPVHEPRTAVEPGCPSGSAWCRRACGNSGCRRTCHRDFRACRSSRHCRGGFLRHQLIHHQHRRRARHRAFRRPSRAVPVEGDCWEHSNCSSSSCVVDQFCVECRSPRSRNWCGPHQVQRAGDWACRFHHRRGRGRPTKRPRLRRGGVGCHQTR
jgi:hypothetical protein